MRRYVVREIDTSLDCNTVVDRLIQGIHILDIADIHISDEIAGHPDFMYEYERWYLMGDISDLEEAIEYTLE